MRTCENDQKLKLVTIYYNVAKWSYILYDPKFYEKYNGEKKKKMFEILLNFLHTFIGVRFNEIWRRIDRRHLNRIDSCFEVLREFVVWIRWWYTWWLCYVLLHMSNTIESKWRNAIQSYLFLLLSQMKCQRESK